MKSVMISIRPKWCELIASGKKTIEVRKTRPKIDTPFKCYIYETKGKIQVSEMLDEWVGGKVIGEFVCNEIFYFGNVATDCWDRLLGNVHEFHKSIVVNQALLSEKEMLSYGGRYGWHISDLVVYEKPKELGEFRHCGANYHYNPPITRPPQSWCYVEELEG